MAWTPTAAGQTLTSAKLEDLASYGVPLHVHKSSDLSRNNDGTSTADPDLVVVLLANRTYVVEAILHESSAANAAGDFRAAWGWTNTATVYIGALGLNAAGLASGTIADVEAVAQVVTVSPSTGIAYGASTSRNTVIRKALVVTGGSNVTFTLLWGQQTSNGNNTTLHAGSSMTARRVD